MIQALEENVSTTGRCVDDTHDADARTNGGCEGVIDIHS